MGKEYLNSTDGPIRFFPSCTQEFSEQDHEDGVYKLLKQNAGWVTTSKRKSERLIRGVKEGHPVEAV